MALPYNINMPLGTEAPRDSQPKILNNFNSIKTLVELNHAPFSDANPGQHTQIQMQRLSNAAASRPTAPSGGIVLYDAIPNVAADAQFPVTLTNSEITLIRDGVAKNYPITASILNGSSPTVFQPGWTYLPSGIILKWSANVSATGQANIVFPVGAGIPVFGTCLTVLVTVADGGAGDTNKFIRLTGVNPTNFDVYASNRTTAGAATVVFTYLAIGY